MGNNINTADAECQLLVAKFLLRCCDFEARTFLPAGCLWSSLGRYWDKEDPILFEQHGFFDLSELEVMALVQAVSGRRMTVRVINGRCTLGFMNLALKTPQLTRAMHFPKSSTGGAQ